MSYFSGILRRYVFRLLELRCYYIFSRNLRYLFHKIQSANTDMARLPREAMQAHVCDSATEALTLLS